jgi:hypothetical protein
VLITLSGPSVEMKGDLANYTLIDIGSDDVFILSDRRAEVEIQLIFVEEYREIN